MKILRFEDLEVGQQARELTRAIYKLTANGSFSGDYGLKDQMRRASVSTMANIADFKGLYESLDHVSRMLSNLIKRLLRPRERRVTR